MHSYVTLIQPATTSADGLLTAYCSGCGDETTRPISKIASISLSNKNCLYSGNVKHPKVIILDADGKQLKKGVDFDVVYKGDCRVVGKYRAVITLLGRYKGGATRYFNILPRGTQINTVEEYENKLVVSVKKRTEQTTGYQIKLATKKDFSDARNVYIKNPAVLKKTVQSLQSGTYYYVKARTYTKIMFDNAEKKLYSAWSDAVVCRTK